MNNISYLIRRLLAHIIDWNLSWLLAYGISILLFPSFNYRTPGVKDLGTIILTFLLFLLFFISKDLVFRNASIGKKIFNLAIVKEGTNEKPSVSALALRNITIILWSVEFIVLLANHTIRIGDIFAKTRVIVAQKH